VNKVFLTGKIMAGPEILRTPKGERIVTFPLWVENDEFSIDVVYLDRQGIDNFSRMKGSVIMVSGALSKPKLPGGHHGIKLKANNIFWMEE
jgi:hypothetical protein